MGTASEFSIDGWFDFVVFDFNAYSCCKKLFISFVVLLLAPFLMYVHSFPSLGGEQRSKMDETMGSNLNIYRKKNIICNG